MTYKLPEHLEPYREYLELPLNPVLPNPTSESELTQYWYMRKQIDLLQRLYDAGLLSQLTNTNAKLPDDDYSNDPESII